MKYEFTPQMNEISGFGGGYEDACRKMLRAGLEWLDANPKSDPQYAGYTGVFGLINEENEDAKSLTQAVVAVVDGDCTGAMHQAVITACLWIRKNGWAAYVNEMSKKEES